RYRMLLEERAWPLIERLRGRADLEAAARLPPGAQADAQTALRLRGEVEEARRRALSARDLGPSMRALHHRRAHQGTPNIAAPDYTLSRAEESRRQAEGIMAMLRDAGPGGAFGGSVLTSTSP